MSNIDPVNPRVYIRNMVDDLSHDEAMRLAKLLEDEGWHLAALAEEYNKLSVAMDDECMRAIDADKRADEYRDALDEINQVLNKVI